MAASITDYFQETAMVAPTTLSAGLAAGALVLSLGGPAAAADEGRGFGRMGPATARTTSVTSSGSEPPLVSQRTTQSAPASAAARAVARAYSASSRYPSKKCSPSKTTSFPSPFR